MSVADLQAIESSAFAFLVKCLRPDTKAADLASAVPAMPDWPDLLLCARHHRIIPVLWKRLSALSNVIPDAAARELEISVRSNSVRCALLMNELQKVSTVLNAKGIPHFCFKGPVMSFTLYGDAAARQSADLDLLIPSAHLIPARSIMLDTGYRPYLEMGHSEFSLFMKGEWGCGLINKSNNIYCDLDSGITPAYFGIPMKAEQFWANRQQVNIEGFTFNAPSPLDLLILLSIHAAKHSWSRLAWLLDIKMLSNRLTAEDWMNAQTTAHKLGCNNILGMAVIMAHRVLGADIPDSILQHAECNKAVIRLTNQVMTKWRLNTINASGRKRDFFFFMSARERLRDRVLTAVRFLITPGYRDIKAVKLPSGLLWLHHLIRPFRVFWTHLRPGA